ncbi:hypothetical protein L249_3233 [Ophiocordyceps polyrhachis-furcata BCC 54312]|uniref:BZIP domain-containing protein n=1 Tax=Ophiocordyceps polyrhachis-furcata BCC 54312 TaxID=1330021 RepID=A0A367LMR9_9HYPO|nr:hypothetical protein L249_3233 [Ophiocordyceps polyrhachis-furcata BCC 54312]
MTGGDDDDKPFSMSESASISTVDFDALLDLSEFDNNYTSSSLSPTPTAKAAFSSPISIPVTTPGLPASTQQSLSGPSHKYGLYRQQTGFVPGAIANTMAVNQSANAGYQDYYISSLTPDTQPFMFNTSPSLLAMDIDPDPLSTVNPNNIENDGLASPASTSSNVGRLYPGAHSQAALAKANAQQKQRVKDPQPADSLVEQKIAQVLNSMRATPAAPESSGRAAHTSLPRSRKDEDDMDEDERLLASEEGKKLSSKERRQLRNKVSARAFRSRRKEYISQLEAEIATKVNDNNHLRAQNRMLFEENKRLSDLTRMLLSSPSFSNFLDHLSTNPQVKSEPQQEEQLPADAPKDSNPRNGQQSHQEQIGMVMVPEHTVDLPQLSLDNYNFQPQVFVVVDTPQVDISVLSGKTGDFVDDPVQEGDCKVSMPAIERPDESLKVTQSGASDDDEFERDPEYALFNSEPVRETNDDDGSGIVSGIESNTLSSDPHVDTEPEEVAAQAMARVKRIRAELEPLVSRLELLTRDL